MTDKLDESCLKDVLAALKKVSKPYELGMQLNIDLSELDTIEKDHLRDLNRQKTEVIKYWLRNSPDASWTTLANAVERMGGHANLVERLIGHTRLFQTLRRNEGQRPTSREDPLQHSSDQYSENQASYNRRNSTTSSVPMRPAKRMTVAHSLCEIANRNILILGKREHGKSTIANLMVNSDGSSRPSRGGNGTSQTHCYSVVLDSTSQRKKYMLNVYDHSGLFEGVSSLNTLSTEIPEDLNLVVIVFKQGRSFDVREREILEGIVTKWKISQISALVVTHCESLTAKERKRAIRQFKKDAKLMGKGVLAVGFPDSSHIQPESPLSQTVEEDKAKLRDLIYSCDERVIVPNALTSSQGFNSDETRLDVLLEEEGEGDGDDQMVQDGQHGSELRCCSIM